MAAAVPLFTFQHLASLPEIVHGITTREGGVSEGRCATLNTSFSVGDESERVEENLGRVATALGTRRADLFSAYQVHGNAVTVVDGNTLDQPRPRCDVLVTSSPARTLMLRYADCTPVLLADPVRKAVGVAHAGWRGTAVRAASAAVEALVERFGTNPRDVVAGIGPAIGPCCYSVGGDVLDAFADRPWAIVRDGEATRLDLWEANRRALAEAGVPADQIEVAALCTQCNAERFFSHRANGGQPAGRFAAAIRLAA